jgi:hypothetical protein
MEGSVTVAEDLAAFFLTKDFARSDPLDFEQVAVVPSEALGIMTPII